MAAGEEEEEEESRRGRRREGEIESAGADCIEQGSDGATEAWNNLIRAVTQASVSRAIDAGWRVYGSETDGTVLVVCFYPAGCGRQDGGAESEEGFGDGAIGSTLDAQEKSRGGYVT